MRVIPNFMIVIVSYVGGYATRDLVLLNNTHTKANYLVIEKHNSQEFTMQTEHGQDFEVTFCPEVKVDFEPGQKLQVLTYEQKVSCKTNVSFIAYTDKYTGKRISYPIPNKEISNVR